MYSGLGGLVFAPKCPQFCPQAIFHFPEDKKKPRNSLNYGAFYEWREDRDLNPRCHC